MSHTSSQEEITSQQGGAVAARSGVEIYVHSRDFGVEQSHPVFYISVMVTTSGIVPKPF